MVLYLTTAWGRSISEGTKLCPEAVGFASHQLHF
jgi:hypothetical protein